ncbi:MAG: porphobilinogen synthase [Chloroflexi bacterium]|nr:porphobilinogen synthase [Chloroflexota bacterium]|tara:strand:- start:6394 stop:7416 length:1023 start_codon:yes stop_codon:yes gene_type:complete
MSQINNNTFENNSASPFPAKRLRRLRQTASLRKMLRETRLSVSDFIYPIFVTHGTNRKIPIEPMPGQYQLSIDLIIDEVEEVRELGIRSILLFGIPSQKDSSGYEAFNEEGVIQQAVRMVKQKFEDIVVITDVCLCEYMDHGHCGVLQKNGTVDNDQTLELLAKIAISHARSGADIIAPSAMMDGQISTIRAALDTELFNNVPIMAYAAKMNSSFYGPFRVAAESAPKEGDRKTYQMDGSNRSEAIRELIQDAAEGADILMVKPALAYLDIISLAKNHFHIPIAAYNVSGEYSMLVAASANGWIDQTDAMIEMLTSIKRAGADLIITYFAKSAAKVINTI